MSEADTDARLRALAARAGEDVRRKRRRAEWGSHCRWSAQRYVNAYLAMARFALYRPQAPSDGFGHITLTKKQGADRERFEREAIEYAKRFRKEEDTLSFRIGCSNGSTNQALIWIIEAARQICGGFRGDRTAIVLLEMALVQIRRSEAKHRMAADVEALKRQAQLRKMSLDGLEEYFCTEGD